MITTQKLQQLITIPRAVMLEKLRLPADSTIAYADLWAQFASSALAGSGALNVVSVLPENPVANTLYWLKEAQAVTEPKAEVTYQASIKEVPDAPPSEIPYGAGYSSTKINGNWYTIDDSTVDAVALAVNTQAEQQVMVVEEGGSGRMVLFIDISSRAYYLYLAQPATINGAALNSGWVINKMDGNGYNFSQLPGAPRELTGSVRFSQEGITNGTAEAFFDITLPAGPYTYTIQVEATEIIADETYTAVPRSIPVMNPKAIPGLEGGIINSDSTVNGDATGLGCMTVADFATFIQQECGFNMAISSGADAYVSALLCSYLSDEYRALYFHDTAVIDGVECLGWMSIKVDGNRLEPIGDVLNWYSGAWTFSQEDINSGIVSALLSVAGGTGDWELLPLSSAAVDLTGINDRLAAIEMAFADIETAANQAIAGA